MTPASEPLNHRDVIRWGIIGCGDVTEVKSGPGFQKAAGSQLVAVMRRNAALAEDYARRHGVPKWYAEAEALIRDPEVDAVYVATPPATHCEYALKICAAGKPAYVEKPMARNATECERMVKAFAKARLPLFVAFYRRRLPRFLKAKELIEEGAVGRMTGVCYHYAEPKHQSVKPGDLPWRLNAENAGGGLIFDLGSHTLDILDFMLGPLKDIAGAAANLASPYDVEDVVAMSFRTEAAVPGLASWNFASAVREDVIQITGTDGRVSLSTFGLEPVRLETENGVQAFDLPNPPHVAQPLIQTVVDELLGRGSCPSTGETALRTARAMDQALEGYYGGRSDAFWLRPGSWPGRRR
jgi:predicted dehydrogenase